MTLPIEVDQFLSANDFSHHTVRAVRSDLSKFIGWFTLANNEPFDLRRITVRDVADFREHLSLVRRQSSATVNRALISIRRFLGHLVANGDLSTNVAKQVKELRRTALAPKGLSSAEVRRVMREVELRGDVRAAAILGLMLHSGLRVSDVVGLEIDDVVMGPRSGQVVCRHGKGNKQRIVPLCNEARRVLTAYLGVRPPTDKSEIFIGERGPLTDDGVRSICSRYTAISGVKFSPHTLRHTFAHRFLEQTQNDIVALAQILGHENLQTTSIYSRRTEADLQRRVDELRYE